MMSEKLIMKYVAYLRCVTYIIGQKQNKSHPKWDFYGGRSNGNKNILEE